MHRAVFVGCLPLAAALALAALPARGADEDALAIADRADVRELPAARDWRLSLEAAGAQARLRDDGGTTTLKRGTVDLRVDTTPAPGWRLVFADQLDYNDPSLPQHARALNSLKEAYVGWQPRPDLGLDLGRVNVQSVVALGYNPTNWFGHGALRGAPVIDPYLLRSSRQGTVVARGQWLWDGGSLGALVAPHLTSQPRSESWNDTFDLDLAATNSRTRGQLSLSQRWSERLTQQALLYAESGRPPQLGMILSALPAESTTAYLEWVGGRDDSVLATVAGGPADIRWRSRWAVGATYSTERRLSVTAEFHYNSAGLASGDWQGLPAAPPQLQQALRDWVAGGEEMPSRSAWFLYARWQDWPLARVDSSALVRFNNQDRSSLAWLELRWHAADRLDVAVQWQALSGGQASEFGASPEAHRITGILKLWL